MTGRRMQVLWICGAPGAGKSVTAWSLFNRLAADGAAVAYVDIDQLGMLYPAADNDPYRYALKSAALDALIPGYAAAGAHLLIVSGVVDPTDGPGLTTDNELTVCLLAPDTALLHERLLARGWEEADVEEASQEDAALQAAAFVDLTIPTGSLSVTETVARLEPLINPVRPPDSAAAPAPDVVGSASAVPVTVITGARAVGTSTVAFGLATHAWRADRRVGFVDLQQLGFLSGHDRGVGPDADLAISQLASIHRTFAQHGAEHLIVAAHLTATDRPALRALFPAAPVTIVRLRGDAETLTDHVRERATGTGPRLAGDDLLDADESHQALVVETALLEQETLDTIAVDDTCFDVTRRHPTEVIADVAELLAVRS